MTAFQLVGFVSLGVAVSVVLPLIRSWLPRPSSAEAATAIPRWERARPYVATALFSLIVAILIVASVGDTISTWQAAVLAGYAADSTLQKASTGNVNAGG